MDPPPQMFIITHVLSIFFHFNQVTDFHDRIFSTYLLEGKGSCLTTTDLSDGHPLPVDRFNSDGDEGAKWVWA